MEKETRKATDVILDLESKIEILLSLVRNQDLNIKLLSNKLNSVMERLDKNSSNKIIVEAVNTIPTPQLPDNKNIAVSPEDGLAIENNPVGFRRTSRPETFSGDQSFLNKNSQSPNVVFPMQLPKMAENATVNAEVVVPAQATGLNKSDKSKKEVKEEPKSNSVPVVQRVVDKTGKSIFLAEIEIVNLLNGEVINKTRTNGTGKWMASLPIGNYKTIIKKRDSMTKEKVEVSQDIQVDGMSSPLELQTLIIKV